MNQEIIHDFRPKRLCWGWNGLDFRVNNDKKTATMLGIGRGIKAGDHIALTQGEKDYAYLVESIEYKRDPSDMFEANLKIVGTIED